MTKKPSKGIDITFLIKTILFVILMIITPIIISLSFYLVKPWLHLVSKWSAQYIPTALRWYEGKQDDPITQD